VAKTIVVRIFLVWKCMGYLMVVKLSPCVAKHIVEKKNCFGNMWVWYGVEGVFMYGKNNFPCSSQVGIPTGE